MRKWGMFIVALVVAFAFVPDEAGAVKITQQQVKNVCGSKLESNGGAMGCEKKCGLNGEHTCDFGCNPQGRCEGVCKTCGAASRTVLFPKLYSNRVVRQLIGGH